MDEVIRVNSVSKTYKNFLKRPTKALDNISFVVRQGEAVGFIGENGAGKSTTLKILAGAIRPDAGSAFVFGADAADWGARKGAVFVPENPNLPDLLTPSELLKFFAQMHGKRPTASEYSYWLERFELDRAKDKLIKGFSKGMAQRTALAAAMISDAKLLVLDEPLSGLDPSGRYQIVEMLAEYHRQGGTLLFSSHVLFDVERIADRVVAIHAGKIVVDSALAAILAEKCTSYEVCLLTETAEQIKKIVPRDSLNALITGLEGTKLSLYSVKSSYNLESVFSDAVARRDGL